MTKHTSSSLKNFSVIQENKKGLKEEIYIFNIKQSNESTTLDAEFKLTKMNHSIKF